MCVPASACVCICVCGYACVCVVCLHGGQKRPLRVLLHHSLQGIPILSTYISHSSCSYWLCHLPKPVCCLFWRTIKIEDHSWLTASCWIDIVWEVLFFFIQIWIRDMSKWKEEDVRILGVSQNELKRNMSINPLMKSVYMGKCRQHFICAYRILKCFIW